MFFVENVNGTVFHLNINKTNLKCSVLQSKNFGLLKIQDKWKRSWDHTKFMIPLLEHYRDTAGFLMRWKYIHVIYKFNVSVLYPLPCPHKSVGYKSVL